MLLIALIHALAFVLFVLPDQTTSAEIKVAHWATSLPFLAFAIVGVLVVAWRPKNLIGWLCSAIGFALAVGSFGSNEAAKTIAARPNTAELVMYQLGQVTFLLALLGVLPLLVLLFPSGRLPSRRWRPVVWTFAAGLVLYAASSLFKVGSSKPGMPPNPLGWEQARGLLQVTGVASGVFFPVFVVLVLVSLVLRYRRARGDERLQFKWLMFAAVMVAALLPTVGPVVERVHVPFVGAVFFSLLVGSLPAAIGVAVLKYRLYDIDRIISRTLGYGLLTVLLGGLYAGAVLGLGQLFGGIRARPPAWSVAGATLGVAALFHPLRRRIQTGVDRRFYRHRYDVARTIEGFSARVRDETDLDSLSALLLSVVRQTMDPTLAVLWLQPTSQTAARGVVAGR